MNQTAENVRLLSIFHYVLGSLTYFIALFPIFHFAVGLFLLLAPLEEWAEDSSSASSGIESIESGSDQEIESTEIVSSETEYSGSGSELNTEDIWMMRGMGGIFAGVAGIFMLSGFVLATLMIIAGRRLSKHRSHTFCLIIAGLECMVFPFHTILGVFTFLQLLNPEGRALFGTPSSKLAAD